MPKGQKLLNVIEKYSLESVETELIDRWTSSDNSDSLFDLENFVNTAIVERVIENQADNKYPDDYDSSEMAYLLHADCSQAERFENVSQVEITEVKNWFGEYDINLELLTNDLVSYNTVYQFLTNIQEVEAAEGQRRSTTAEERKEIVENRLTSLQQRVGAVANQGLASLVNANAIPDTYDIQIQFRVECTECDRRQDLLQFIRNNGCNKCDTNLK